MNPLLRLLCVAPVALFLAGCGTTTETVLSRYLAVKVSATETSAYSVTLLAHSKVFAENTDLGEKRVEDREMTGSAGLFAPGESVTASRITLKEPGNDKISGAAELKARVTRGEGGKLVIEIERLRYQDDLTAGFAIDNRKFEAEPGKPVVIAPL